MQQKKRNKEKHNKSHSFENQKRDQNVIWIKFRICDVIGKKFNAAERILNIVISFENCLPLMLVCKVTNCC